MGPTLKQMVDEAVSEYIDEPVVGDVAVLAVIDWLRTPEVRNAMIEAFVSVVATQQSMQLQARFLAVTNEICRKAAE